MAGEEYVTLAGDPSEPIGGPAEEISGVDGQTVDLPPPPAPDAPHVRTLGLTVPLDVGGERLKSISLRPLTMAEVHRFTSADEIPPFEFLSTMSGFPKAVLANVSWADGQVLIGLAASLLPDELTGALLAAGERTS